VSSRLTPRALLVLALALVGIASCQRPRRKVEQPPEPAKVHVPAPSEVPAGRSFVVAAAGDIAGRSNRHLETAALLLELHEKAPLAAILALGDLAYPRGEYHDFLAYYHPSWGHPALRPLTRPVPGNHEYNQGRSDARGYFDYWNGPDVQHGQAGERGLGYYSFDLGDWHLIAVNTSDGCRRVPCVAGSAMHTWLVADLRENTKKCVLAYWHHPRFQLGTAHKSNATVAPIWDALYQARADVVLSGHEHNFQQLARLNREGKRDADSGIRSFVVGTGGAYPYRNFDHRQVPGAGEVTMAQQAGVLVLTLEPGAYRWRFIAVVRGASGRVLFEGQEECR
jgi:acid phosphatase type 7